MKLANARKVYRKSGVAQANVGHTRPIACDFAVIQESQGKFSG
jgi:hypothetical protein